MKATSKQKKPETHFPIGTKPSDFRFEIAKVAVSQICKSVGFKSTQLSALETLTEIATLYIKALGKSAALYSNASNRTQSNLIDLINAFHDLSLVQGFIGAATLHDGSNSFLSSRALEDLSVFVSLADEIPFAKPIPREIPISVSISPSPILKSWDSRIPQWLPGFPERKFGKIEKDKKIRGGSELWENSESVRNEIGCILSANQKKKRHDGDGDGDVAMKRKRMRFKFGEKPI